MTLIIQPSRLERKGSRRLRGRLPRVTECYGFVTAVLRPADPELLPYVAEAREGLVRLRVD